MRLETNLIGISGKAGSGKDLIGKIIQYLGAGADKANIPFDKWNGDPVWGNTDTKFHIATWEIRKFATKVKEVLSLLTGIPVEDFEKEEVKDSYMPEEWNRWSIDFELHKNFGIFSSEQLARSYASFCANKGMVIEIKEERITYRQGLQYVGTDLFRDKFHPNTWVNALFSDYKLIDTRTFSDPSAEPIYPNWIITDLRFPNELEAIKERGGIVIRVNRPCSTCGKLVREENSLCSNGFHGPQHESETALDDYKNWDYVINNNSTISFLTENVRQILIKEKLI